MADSGTNPVRPNTFELEADVNVEFNEAASRQQINSGESVKTLFGKLRKFLADLKAVAFSGAYSDLSGVPESLPADGGNADTVDGLHADGFIKVNRQSGYDCNTLYDAGLYLCSGDATNTPNNLKYGSLLAMPYRKPYGNAGADYCAQIYIPNGDVDDTSMWYRTSLQNTWNGWKRSCDGGDAATVNGHTVAADVPANAVFTDTTYAAATPSSNGLMSTTDKVKLDGIDVNQILTSAHCIMFTPYNLKYFALDNRILLFSNDDDAARGIYFANNTPNDITVCALISASAAGPVVQYGYGTGTYPDMQNTGIGREWFASESITTYPTIYAVTVPSGRVGYYGVYQVSESAYATINDIRCPYFNYF